MTLTQTARTISLESHGGDKNQHDGELYLLHVNRVAIGSAAQARRLQAELIAFGIVDEYGNVDLDMVEAAAWLHDVVEDTFKTLAMIEADFVAAGHNYAKIEKILAAVALLTKPDDGSLSNKDYYLRIARNPLARAVKLADLQDNFRRNHLITDEAKKLRMATKYSLGMDILG
jgi:(p)ppGpp synthase/HD superfamily hydrolase